MCLALVATVLPFTALTGSSPVVAAGVPVPTSTTTARVAPSTTATLAGLSVSGNATDQLSVTLATDIGTVGLPSLTNLSLAPGNSAIGTSAVTFSGLEVDINAALASAELTVPGALGTANVSLTAMVYDADRVLYPVNQHFYEWVSAPGGSWADADVAARASSFLGQSGYLAAIVTADVNDFLSSTRMTNSVSTWIGMRAYESIATDGTQVYANVGGTIYPRVFRWTVGADQSPFAGDVVAICDTYAGPCSFTGGGSYYSSFQVNEPNNDASTSTAYEGEWAGSTNYFGNGMWNDLAGDSTESFAYFVEYGGKTNANPALGQDFEGVSTDTSQVEIRHAAVVADAPAISGVPADQSVELTWSPPSNGGATITSYEVSIDGGGWTTIATTSSGVVVDGNIVTTIAATVTGLTNGTEYDIRIRAVNSAGQSAPSNTVTTTPRTLPGAPTALVTTPGDDQVSVAFTPPADNGGAPITVYTATASPGGATGTCASSPCNVTGLTNGTTYSFTVVATNVVGDGPPSAAANETPLAVPDPPTATSATPDDQEVSIAFTPPADNGGTAITGYTATAAPGGATGGCASSPCTITGLTNGTSYSFTVVATNSVGDSAPSAAATATPRTVPDPPTGLVGTPGDDSVSIVFVPPADNGGAPVTLYTATATPGGATGTCSASPCNVSGLANGTSYSFTVVATNAAGDSLPSAPTDATPIAVAGAPTAVVATRVAPTFGSTSVSVSFTPPGDTGGTTITGYVATASPGGRTANCATSPCVVTGLALGQAYTFTVRAVNSVGPGPASAPSNSVILASLPGAPRNVTAAPRDGGALVTFLAPTSNGNATITSYRVRATPGSATATCTTSPCELTGLTNGAAYAITVAATNLAGQGPASSAANVIPTKATGGFLSITPTRALDARESTAVKAGSITTVDLSEISGLPADSSAVVLNVTSVFAAKRGYFTVFACGRTRPTTSNVNYEAGAIVAGSVTTKLGPGMKVCVYAHTTTDLLVDVNGAYSPTVGTTQLQAITPRRLLDTRETRVKVAAGTIQRVPIIGTPTIPSDTEAVVLNLTAVVASGNGFLTLFDCDSKRPTASNLNFVVGQTVPNSAISGVGADGDVCIYSHGLTDLVVDVTAVYRPSATLAAVVPVEPDRLLDTREGGGKVAAQTVRRITIPGAVGNSDPVTAAVLNVTATEWEVPGFVTVYPCDSKRPTASNVNPETGLVSSNSATAATDSNGTVCLYTHKTTHIVVDLFAVQQ